jgi:hypothetical protein
MNADPGSRRGLMDGVGSQAKTQCLHGSMMEASIAWQQLARLHSRHRHKSEMLRWAVDEYARENIPGQSINMDILGCRARAQERAYS